MAKEIKQRIVLDGEKQYASAIKEAQRNLKLLRSELKAETTELGKNATEQQKSEVKAKSLKAQIAEQEKVVRTLKAALEEVREKYADNEDEIAKWELKLNSARATLADMQNDLESIGDGFGTMSTDAAAATVATKSVADSLNSLSEVGESVASAIEGIFTGVVDTVSESISAIWEKMVEIATKANSWSDIAGFWNTDATNIQKWSHAVETAYDSFDDLSNAVTRINSRADADEHGMVAGVSVEGYKDRWEYAMAVLDTLSQMEDHDALLEEVGEIFGEKRATKVLDLINDWDKIRGNLDLYDTTQEGGIGMTEEQIQDMSTLAEQVGKIQTTWNAFIDSFVAEHFAKLGLDLTGDAQTILEDLIKYLDSGDDEDLAKLEKDIETFFNRIKEALEKAAGKLDEAGKKLEESDNGIVRTLGKALQGLAEALEWISDENNIDKVIAGFETLAAFWLVGKGVRLISSIAELAANFKVIQGFNTASALGGVVVSVALAGILCMPLITRLLKGDTRTDEEVARDEKINKIGEEMREAGMTPPAGNQDVLKMGFEKLFNPNGGSETMQKIAEDADAARAEAEEAQRAIVEGSGPSSPVKRARMDATAEQQAAAEAFWDVWRSGDWGENDEAYDAAWEALEKAFAGEEETFDQLNTWLDRIMEEYSSDSNNTDFDAGQWMDLPATWWTNPSGTTDDNGVTSKDLEGLNSIPSGVETASERGVRKGLSGMKVEIDGEEAGRILAPYISQEIAKTVDY